MIIGRRHFYDIAPDKIEGAEGPEDGEGLPAGKAAGDRRSRPRRKGRVEAIDVKGEIGLGVADQFKDTLRTSSMPSASTSRTLKMVRPAVSGACGADADLHRPHGIDEAFAHRPADEGAVVDPAAIIGPGVLVCVELNQCQWSVFGGVRFEERIGDEMIAAEREQVGSAAMISLAVASIASGNAGRHAEIERAVAIVDDRQRFERVEAEGILRIAVEDRRSPADRLRPKAGAGAV